MTVMRNDSSRVHAAPKDDGVLSHRGIYIGVVVTDKIVGRNESVTRWPKVVFQVTIAIRSAEAVATRR